MEQRSFFYHQIFNSAGESIYDVRLYTAVEIFAHFHRSYELIYVFDGTAGCFVNGREFTVYAGEFALILPNEVHSCIFDDCSHGWIGVFSADFIPAFDKLIKGKTADRRCFTCSPSTLDYLSEKMLNTSVPHPFVIKSCLYAVCADFLSQVELIDRQSKDISFMTKISDYISQNLDADINLRTLAEYLGYDYSYTSRLFKQIFNMPFNEYINVWRFHSAVSLLESSDLSVTTVALRCGFRSVRTFNSVFLAQAGMSPTEYRRRHSKPKLNAHESQFGE